MRPAMADPHQQWLFGHVGKYTFIATPPDDHDVVSVVSIVDTGMISIVVKPIEDDPMPLHQLWLFVLLPGVT
jgi:hypothetical protein